MGSPPILPDTGCIPREYPRSKSRLLPKLKCEPVSLTLLLWVPLLRKICRQHPSHARPLLIPQEVVHYLLSAIRNGIGVDEAGQ